MKRKNPSSLFAKMVPRLRLCRVAVVVLFVATLAMGIGIVAIVKRGNANAREPNVIVICVDSLRADHLGCYGYRRRTSPRIDALAETGILFEHALSNSSYTRESVSTFLSGRLPSSGGGTGLLAAPGKDGVGMAGYFANAGYRTGFFSASNILSKKEFHRDFLSVHVDERKNNGNSVDLSARAIDFIRENRERKFMIYLHYMDPHHPYNPPREFHHRFSDVAFDHPPDLAEDMGTYCNDWIEDGFGPGDPRYEDMVLRYDAEIAYTDHAIGLVLDKLEELDLLDNTIIVLTADHGEEFLDHRYLIHAWTLFNESVHVPLIVWGKPFSSPARISTLVSGVDILPTLLHLAGIPHDAKAFDGHSLFTRRNDALQFDPPRQPYIGELLLQHRNILRAVIRDNWKYMACVVWTVPEDRPRPLSRTPAEMASDPRYWVDTWAPVRREFLFDLSVDPLEQNDLLAAHPEIAGEMRAILARYKSRCDVLRRERSSKNGNPSSVGLEMEKLKSLGYL